MQQCAYIYLLLNYSTCFGRPTRPSSGVHKTVVAASGTDHTILSFPYKRGLWSKKSANLCLVISRFFELHRLGLYSDGANCRSVILSGESEVRRWKRARAHTHTHTHIYIYEFSTAGFTRKGEQRKNSEKKRLPRPRLERGTFQIRSRRTEHLVHRILLTFWRRNYFFKF